MHKFKHKTCFYINYLLMEKNSIRHTTYIKYVSISFFFQAKKGVLQEFNKHMPSVRITSYIYRGDRCSYLNTNFKECYSTCFSKVFHLTYKDSVVVIKDTFDKYTFKLYVD